MLFRNESLYYNFTLSKFRITGLPIMDVQSETCLGKSYEVDCHVIKYG